MTEMHRVTIASVGQYGEGVAEIDGAKIYIPFTLPGEEVEISRDGDRGKLVSLLTPSPIRATPFCSYFGSCGGCALQHLDAESYAAFKQNLVRVTLALSGMTTDIRPLVDATGAGRRRATLHARANGAGYMQAKSHDLTPIEACPILAPALKAAPAIAKAIASEIGPCDVSFTVSLTGLDVAVQPAGKTRNQQQLISLARQFRLARLTLDGEMIVQAQVPVLAIGRARLNLPPRSFLQATEAAELALAELVLEAAGRAKHVADLFCGMGPFALRLAEITKVYAADSDQAAITALQNAARHTQGLRPINALKRDLFRDPLAPVELAPFDAVIMDPPRAGAEAQAKELALSKVPLVISVSCDPKSFARDAAILIAGGYVLEQVTPVDQFAFSTHVELVGIFRK